MLLAKNDLQMLSNIGLTTVTMFFAYNILTMRQNKTKMITSADSPKINLFAYLHIQMHPQLRILKPFCHGVFSS